jgi:NAD(P)-dependent dehydrogenase (short-subunit alcohol dehydrogenase family)
LTSAHRLDGRVALVAGGSRGIGRASARALAARGARVIALARTLYAPEAAAPGGDDLDQRIQGAVADVGDWRSVEPAVAAVIERYGRVDVLINSAGIPGARAPVWQLEPEAFQRALAVNILGPFHLMKLLLPGMIQRGTGVVINVSSGAAARPRPRRAMYGTSKAALDHLTLAVAQEVEPAGVRVHVFYPGPVDTDLFRASQSDPHAGAEERARTAARIRAGELQEPEEPAAALAWLATAAGAAFAEVVVPWRDLQVRQRLRAMPGFSSGPPPSKG